MGQNNGLHFGSVESRQRFRDERKRIKDATGKKPLNPRIKRLRASRPHGSGVHIATVLGFHQDIEKL